jgi:hypothetical protein
MPLEEQVAMPLPDIAGFLAELQVGTNGPALAKRSFPAGSWTKQWFASGRAWLGL